MCARRHAVRACGASPSPPGKSTTASAGAMPSASAAPPPGAVTAQHRDPDHLSVGQADRDRNRSAVRKVDMSRRGAHLSQDSFPDHFDRHQMRAQQIQIRRVEHLQQLVGWGAACGHAGQSGAFAVPIGAAPVRRRFARPQNYCKGCIAVYIPVKRQAGCGSWRKLRVARRSAGKPARLAGVAQEKAARGPS